VIELNIKSFIACLMMLCAVVASAATVGELPSSPFVDTESVTNVVFDAGDEDTRWFCLSMEIGATSSNNLEVAFGRDVNQNGLLDRDEMDLVVGWDSGEWFFRDRRAAQGQRVARSEGERKLNWRLKLNASREVVALTAVDAEGPVFAGVVYATLFDTGWNLMRVVARGEPTPDGLVVARAEGWGFRVILR